MVNVTLNSNKRSNTTAVINPNRKLVQFKYELILIRFHSNGTNKTTQIN